MKETVIIERSGPVSDRARWCLDHSVDYMVRKGFQVVRILSPELGGQPASDKVIGTRFITIDG